MNSHGVIVHEEWPRGPNSETLLININERRRYREV
jgi:hypothetical protein